MARLFSHHDPQRLHACTGGLALLSFLLRFSILIRYGTSFPSWEPKQLALATCVIHGVLHLTSFIPPVPQKRVMHSPMIWVEFRAHNAIFGLRHVFATALALLLPSLTWTTRFAIALLLTYGPALLASIVTARIGDHQKRTTNSMAYPKHLDQNQIQKTKRWYANAQFAATFFALSHSPTCTFWPLLAIELAPLMMTLVRKNLASTTAYHRVYSIGLIVPYFVCLIVITKQLQFTNILVEEPQMLHPFLSLGILSAIIAPALRRRGASKVLSLGIYIIMLLVSIIFEHVQGISGTTSILFSWNVVMLITTALGICATPLNEARWMVFSPYPPSISSVSSTSNMIESSIVSVVG
mmetsp:Transcript_6871/g.10206  ORF Transcript_6871/g.10206 Transcript_6871/m.10206 type:complete len:353 (+) Transcript_6871:31-1089(+)